MTPASEIHIALPVNHGGTNAVVIVACVFFYETEAIAFAIALYYNGIIDSFH